MPVTIIQIQIPRYRVRLVRWVSLLSDIDMPVIKFSPTTGGLEAYLMNSEMLKNFKSVWYAVATHFI